MPATSVLMLQIINEIVLNCKIVFQFVDEKMTQKILKEARRQQAQLEEDFEERGDGHSSRKNIKGKISLGASSGDVDQSDDDDFEFDGKGGEEEYEDVVSALIYS